MSLELSDLNDDENSDGIDEEDPNREHRIPIELPDINLINNNGDIGPELSQVTEQRRACNYLYWKLISLLTCFMVFGFVMPIFLVAYFPMDRSGLTAKILILCYCASIWLLGCCCPCCIGLIYMHDLRQRQEELINNLLGNEVLTEETENNLTDKLCSICIDNIEIGESYTKLECSHSYHRECLKQWVEVKSTCPLCREAL